MKAITSFCLAALLAAPAAMAADAVVLTPDDIQFTGARAMIDANPVLHVKTMRMRIEPNKTMPPHGPGQGYFIATVISGTLQLGIGDTFDEAALKTLPPGSVFTHAPSQKHFVRTGDEPVVLQVTMIQPEGAKHHHQHGAAHEHGAKHEHGHHEHGEHKAKAES